MLAQEEARLLDHHFIGTEHLLLGLLHEGEGLAAQALTSMGISLTAAREEVERSVGPASTDSSSSPPFTPRAKQVLELSLREALQLGHSYIGTEHILLGLVREGEGAAAQVLVGMGAELARVRQQVIELLSGHRRIGALAPESAPIGHMRRAAGPLTLAAGPPSATPPDCPHCQSPLASSARLRRFDLTDEESGIGQAFLVVFCGSCGSALAFKPLD